MSHEKQYAANCVTSTNLFNFLAINSVEKKHCQTNLVDFFVEVEQNEKKNEVRKYLELERSGIDESWYAVFFC